MEALQVVLLQFKRCRCPRGIDGEAAGVEATGQSRDCAALAGCVDALAGDRDAAGALIPEVRLHAQQFELESVSIRSVLGTAHLQRRVEVRDARWGR